MPVIEQLASRAGLVLFAPDLNLLLRPGESTDWVAVADKQVRAADAFFAAWHDDLRHEHSGAEDDVVWSPAPHRVAPLRLGLWKGTVRDEEAADVAFSLLMSQQHEQGATDDVGLRGAWAELLAEVGSRRPEVELRKHGGLISIEAPAELADEVGTAAQAIAVIHGLTMFDPDRRILLSANREG